MIFFKVLCACYTYFYGCHFCDYYSHNCLMLSYIYNNIVVRKAGRLNIKTTFEARVLIG